MFGGFTNDCPHCGQWHTGSGVCPKVKSLEYHENGTLKKVVYFGDEPEPQFVPIPPYTPGGWEEDDANWGWINGGNIIRKP